MRDAEAARPRDVVVLDGGPVSIATVVRVARRRDPVALGAKALARMAAGRRVVESWAAEGRTAYGLTTGLGAAVDTPVPGDDLAAFQGRALAARAVGMGDTLATDEVRAMLFVRLAGLAHGASGINPGFAEAIRDMLNRGVHPVVHRTGSLGEADLAPLAEAFLCFVGQPGQAAIPPPCGEGRVAPQARAGVGVRTVELHSAPPPPGSASPSPPSPQGGGMALLAAAGIVSPRLGPKDAVALINANACSVGLGALALDDVARAVEAATVAGALSLEAFRANLSVIDARVAALRPAPGQAEMSAELRRLLAGSDLFEPGRARRVQDPLSFRCLAPVHGVVARQIDGARLAIEADLAGAGDSPAVLLDPDDLLSTVNFDTTAIAVAFEALGQAISHAAAIATFRIAKLMSPELSGLPRFLTRRGGTRTGFATAQKTAAALEAEIRHLALPLGAMAAPVADGIEDHAPMTLAIVEKTAAIAARWTRLAAIELTVAAAAADLRVGIRLGRGTAAAHAFVRAHVAPFDEDRVLGADFRHVAEAIAAGTLQAAMAKVG